MERRTSELTGKPDCESQFIGAPPCFFWNVCSARAAMEKGGRSVCHSCAAQLRGVAYPLRQAGIEPIYITGHAAAEALDMVPTTPRSADTDDLGDCWDGLGPND